jgi:hypothetical protein
MDLLLRVFSVRSQWLKMKQAIESGEAKLPLIGVPGDALEATQNLEDDFWFLPIVLPDCLLCLIWRLPRNAGGTLGFGQPVTLCISDGFLFEFFLLH